VIDEVVDYRRLLRTDHHIGRQGTDQEQQDDPKAKGKFVGDFHMSKLL